MFPERPDLSAWLPASDPGALRARWRAAVESDLHGAPFERRLVARTYEGLDVQPLYTDEGAMTGGGGYSGMRPLVRGGEPLGTVPAGWDIRQERAEADPARFNEALREDLEGGVTSVVVRLDACGRAGLDPRDPRGAHLAARDGCTLYTVNDLDEAMRGVHLEMIGVNLEAGSAFVPAALTLAALWERRGVPARAARGSFQADPLAVLARDGWLPETLEHALGDVGRLAKWTLERYGRPAARVGGGGEGGGVRSVRVGTAPYHHAGATATQDLALALASGVEYLRALRAAGLTLPEACGQMDFSMAVGCNFFLALAKVRALRRLWAKVVESCGGGEESQRLRLFVRPSRRVMTTRDPWVNILRTSVCVLAGGMSGADAVGATPFDAALGEPSELARRLARNTHHVLMEECQAHRVCDAAGGSYAVERLTHDLSAKAWAIFQEIERRGGMGVALTSGWVGEQVQEAARARLRNLSTRRDVVVGVSDYAEAGEQRPSPPAIDREGLVRRAIERLAARGVARAGAASVGGRDAWNAALAAAQGGASIPEIAGVWRGVTRGREGEGATIPAPLHVHTYAEPFERLREASERLAQQVGHPPRGVLVACGSPGEHLARLNYALNLLQSGGFEVHIAREPVAHEPGAGDDEARRVLCATEAHLAVICGSDAAYPSAVPILAPRLHRAGARRVVLAGNPGEHEAAYRAAGVDHFAFVRCDVVALLTHLLREEGAPL